MTSHGFTCDFPGCHAIAVAGWTTCAKPGHYATGRRMGRRPPRGSLGPRPRLRRQPAALGVHPAPPPGTLGAQAIWLLQHYPGWSPGPRSAELYEWEKTAALLVAMADQA